MKASILTAQQFEDSELFEPRAALEKAGVEVDIATPEKGHQFRGKHGKTVIADLTLREVDPDAYELLVLPGGKAPAELHRDEHALCIAKAFFERDKPVAAICHGPEILVSARLLDGRRATCHKSVAQALEDSGARYEDAPVVVDGKLITSREPGDLPEFIREMLRLIGKASALSGSSCPGRQACCALAGRFGGTVLHFLRLAPHARSAYARPARHGTLGPGNRSAPDGIHRHPRQVAAVRRGVDRSGPLRQRPGRNHQRRARTSGN